MDVIVGGIQIEPDLRRWLLMGLKEAVDEQAVHACGIGHDLLVARIGIGIGGRETPAVRRYTLSLCHRRAVLSLVHN